MKKWHLSTGLALLAIGAALLAPRILPAATLGQVEAPPEPTNAPLPTLEPTAAVEPSVVTAPDPQVPAAAAPKGEGRTIDVVVALDTSGSMGQLIDSVRARLWDMVNEVDALDRDATLRVGLLAYGSPSYGADTGYVRVVMDLTDDLDELYSRIWELQISGGDEYVGTTVKTAVNTLSWTPAGNDNRRLMFVAGNESAFQGPDEARQVAAHAAASGIVVNTLFAGALEAGRGIGWADVAQSGKGRYFAIDAAQSAVAVATPFDGQLQQLNEALNRTYIPYGAQGQQKIAQMHANDASSSGMGGGTLSSRISTKGSGKYVNPTWDLVDGRNGGQVNLETLDRAGLPKELQGLTTEQLRAEVDRRELDRKKTRSEIGTIQAKRQQWIRDNAAKQAGAGMDEAMAEALAEQL
ncbi:MAG: VWA domain-containing protein [Myxococcales bacterium]|nr:VWA domain-containing protein [Myxococcales bacterium]